MEPRAVHDVEAMVSSKSPSIDLEVGEHSVPTSNPDRVYSAFPSRCPGVRSRPLQPGIPVADHLVPFVVLDIAITAVFFAFPDLPVSSASARSRGS